MSDWKETSNVRESTEKVQVYLSGDRKQTWSEEAEKQGFPSTSKYVLKKVEQARAEERKQRHSYDSEEVERLQKQIDELQQELREERKKEAASTQVGDPDLVKKFLSPQCKTLEEIIRDIIESNVVDQLIRKPVEKQLYKMAQSDEVEFQRGHGWRLKEGNGGEL